jgi:hypothetical protein
MVLVRCGKHLPNLRSVNYKLFHADKEHYVAVEEINPKCFLLTTGQRDCNRLKEDDRLDSLHSSCKDN